MAKVAGASASALLRLLPSILTGLLLLFQAAAASADIRADPTGGHLPNATLGEFYEFRMVGVLGQEPFSFHPVSGPAWLSLATDGTVSGTPDETGTAWFEFDLEDGTGTIERKRYNVFVQDIPVDMQLGPAAGHLGEAVMGEQFGVQFQADGGTAPYSYTYVGTLPPGLRLDSSTGELYGSAATTGRYTFTVRATDYWRNAVWHDYTIDAVSYPGIVMIPQPGALPDAVVGAGYEVTVGAAENPGAYTYFQIGDGVPGLVINAATGTIAGHATTPGDYAIRFLVERKSDGVNLGEFDYTLKVVEPDYYIALDPPGGLLGEGVVGQAFAATISASGGTAPYRYEITDGTFPLGLELDASTGHVSGMPEAPGDLSAYVRVTDAQGAAARALYNIRIEPKPDSEPLTLTPSGRRLPRGTTGIPYSQAFTAGGGTGSYHFGIRGNIPEGLSFDPESATLSGTPTASCNCSFTIVAHDDYSNYAAATYGLAVRQPNGLLPASGDLISGQVSVPFRQSFLATGGMPPFTYTLSSGSLPAGLSFSAADRAVAGTPEEFGDFSFSVTASDYEGITATSDYRLTIEPAVLHISPDGGTLAEGRVGVFYDLALTASGTADAVRYSLGSGRLPGGIALDPDTGRISGTPTKAGTFDFTVDATDGRTASGSATYRLTIAARVVLDFVPAAGSLPQASVGYPFQQQLQVSPSDYADEALFQPDGPLPDWLTLSSGGLLSGTPPAVGSYEFGIRASVPDIGEGSVRYTLAVSEPEFTLSPPSGPLPTVKVGGYVGQGFFVPGAPAGLYALSYEGTVPPGLTFDAASGILRGTATEAGETDFTIRVTRTIDGKMMGAYAYRLVVDTADIIEIRPATLPKALLGIPFEQAVTASGGDSPYTYGLIGDLPAGVSFDPVSATFGGAPKETGSFPLTLLAVDADSDFVVHPLTLEVGEHAFEIRPDPGSTFSAQAGRPFSQTFGVPGVPPSAYALELDGAPPGGLAFDPASGTLAGTPTSAGGADFAIRVTRVADGKAMGTFAYRLLVEEPAVITVTPAILPDALLDIAYDVVLHPSGGQEPYGFALTGRLPEGLAFDPSLARFSGIPKETGTFPLGVSITGRNGASLEKDYSLTVTEPAPVVFSPAPGALPPAVQGEPYEQSISATGLAGPVAYEVSGTLPEGLSFDGGSGMLSGTPAKEGSHSFTVTARDGRGVGGQAAYTLEVALQPLSAADRTVEVPEGQAPADIDLTAGSKGGPFSGAVIVRVDPAVAGTATILEGGSMGFAAMARSSTTPIWLRFQPNKEFSGLAQVQYRLVGARGATNIATVAYRLRADTRHVREKFSRMGRNFVGKRQRLLADAVEAPGLADRLAGGRAGRPAGLRLSGDSSDLRFGYGTSLRAIRPTHGRDGFEAGQPPYDVWIDASYSFSNADRDGAASESFLLSSAGVDYLLGDRLLVGIAVHLDRMRVTTDEGKVAGTGYLAGPHLSLRLDDTLYLDAGAYMGESWNDIEGSFLSGGFETERLLVQASLNGHWTRDALSLRPGIEFSYARELSDAYTVTGGDAAPIAVPAASSELARLGVRAQARYRFAFEDGTALAPELGFTLGGQGTPENFGTSLYGDVNAGIRWSGQWWSLRGRLSQGFDTTGERDMRLGATLGVRF